MKYVMLLRGMGPGDPNFNNQTVCHCLEDLGYTNVRSLLASGNYLFESDETDTARLETAIEDAIAKTGYRRAVIVRSSDQITQLMTHDPFEGRSHSEHSYLLVTFMKQPKQPDFGLPYQPPDKPYVITSYQDGMVFSVTDNTLIKTPDLMSWLERQFGKDITSRTWNTMQRIHQRLS